MTSITDYFALASNGTTPVPSTLASQKVLAASSCSLNLATGWSTTTPVHFLMYQVNAQGALIAGTVSGWKGILTGTTINSLTLKFGNDTNYPATTTIVQLQPTSAWEDDLINGILQVIQQNGLLQPNLAITTPTVTSPIFLGTNTDWFGANEAWTYLSANSVTVPTNATTKYDIGDLVQMTQSAVVSYYAVTALTATTLTLSGVSGVTVANSAISNNMYSKVNPHGFNPGVPFNPYKFSVFVNSSYVAPAAPHTIQYSAKTYDTGANFSTSTYKFTCPVAGFYLFSATVSNSTNANIFYGIQLIQNGAGISPNIGNIAVQSNNLIYQSMCVSQLVACSVNDVISAQWTGQVGVGNYYVGNGVFSGFLVSLV